MRAAYHDACHLAHAQGVTLEPRALLRQIPNLTLLEIGEADICCGSAGTYNMEQPDIAGALGTRKAENVAAVGAQAVITGNIRLPHADSHPSGQPAPAHTRLAYDGGAGYGLSE